MSDEHEFSVVDVSKASQVASKPGSGFNVGMDLGDIRLLPRWCPAYRQHVPGPGSHVEHVKAHDTAEPHQNVGVWESNRENPKRQNR